MVDTRSRQAAEPMNASKTPWTFTVDLQLDKTFSIFQNIQAQLYIRVTNLFNKKNVLNVYPATGTANDDGYISDVTKSSFVVDAYGPGFIDFYNKINIVNSQSYWDLVGKQLYDHPRQILFGMRMEF